MRKVDFIENDDGSDVIVCNSNDKYDYQKYGELSFEPDDDEGSWVLWTGQSYSGEDSPQYHQSDYGVSYSGDLESTKEEIIEELG